MQPTGYEGFNNSKKCKKTYYGCQDHVDELKHQFLQTITYHTHLNTTPHYCYDQDLYNTIILKSIIKTQSSHTKSNKRNKKTVVYQVSGSDY